MHLRTDTGSNAHFAAVPYISKPRNTFSVADKHVTTMQFDYLYPLFNKFIYPGDTLSISEKVMARLATQTVTLFDDLYFELHAWFVPMRLIQTNWARYQFNAQPLGPSQDNSSLTSPKITMSGLGSGGFVAKSLYDYFGYPTEVNYSSDVEHMNNYYARGYNLIWNTNYRDQNLQNAIPVDLDDGPDNPADYVPRKRGKRHDLFTSALTAAQKGTPVSIPLGTTAQVRFTGADTDIVGIRNSSGAIRSMVTGNAASNDVKFYGGSAVTSQYLYTDLASATSATLNQLRQSYAIQHLLEADARGGTRDVEAIQHRWGVTVPDYRLQRPEFIAGQIFTFDGHVVPQTSASTEDSPQATLTQFSQAVTSFNINHSFVEHGVFMILISARSNITYQQGLPKELSYRTRYDWYQPEFANLGEVAVKNKEIYAIGGDGTQDNATFGFQEYAYELRYGLNRVSAEMRSNYGQSLDSYHMADDYFSLPTLGSAWIESNTPIGRNIVVQPETADPIQINSLAMGKIARTLPMYSIPGLTRL